MNFTCPCCGADNDAASEVTGTDARGVAQPKPGDFNLCITCGDLSIFTEGGLRLPTPAEREDATKDVIYVRTSTLIKEMNSADD